MNINPIMEVMKMNMIRMIASSVAGAALSAYLSSVVSDKLIDIASDGLVFKKKGLILSKYENLNGKKISRKVAKYKSEISDMTQTEVRDALNRLGGIAGTSAAIGTVAAANIIIDKCTEQEEDEFIPPFAVYDDDDEE